MKKLVLLIYLIPGLLFGQKKKFPTEVNPPVGNNTIYVYTSVQNSVSFRIVLQMLKRGNRQIELLDSTNYKIETALFALTPSYDMKIFLEVKEGVVRMTGDSYNRMGVSLGAVCGSPIRGSAQAFGQINYFALSLMAELDSKHVSYQIE